MEDQVDLSGLLHEDGPASKRDKPENNPKEPSTTREPLSTFNMKPNTCQSPPVQSTAVSSFNTVPSVPQVPQAAPHLDVRSQTLSSLFSGATFTNATLNIHLHSGNYTN